MASLNKQRKRLLKNIENLSEEEIAQAVKSGITNLHEISEVCYLTPLRLRRITDLIEGRIPTTPRPQGYPTGNMPPATGGIPPGNPMPQSRSRFPTPRKEDFNAMRNARRNMIPTRPYQYPANGGYQSQPQPQGGPYVPPGRQVGPVAMRGPLTPPPFPGSVTQQPVTQMPQSRMGYPVNQRQPVYPQGQPQYQPQGYDQYGNPVYPPGYPPGFNGKRGPQNPPMY